jgi:hypothetical protein
MEEVMTNSAGISFQNFRNGAIQALPNIVVALLLFIGVLFLYEGLGIDFRILDYSTLKPYGIPIGLFLLCSGTVTARLWIFEPDPKVQDPGRATTPPQSFAGALSSLRPYGTAPTNENRAPSVGLATRVSISGGDPCRRV